MFRVVKHLRLHNAQDNDCDEYRHCLVIAHPRCDTIEFQKRLDIQPGNRVTSKSSFPYNFLR